jgi:integrase
LHNYAALLFAATYGLRVSDVANLTMDGIDWSNRSIQIIQCKTQQPLSLPLTDVVCKLGVAPLRLCEICEPGQFKATIAALAEENHFVTPCAIGNWMVKN